LNWAKLLALNSKQKIKKLETSRFLRQARPTAFDDLEQADGEDVLRPRVLCLILFGGMIAALRIFAFCGILRPKGREAANCIQLKSLI
jgi:hypothetical protein